MHQEIVFLRQAGDFVQPEVFCADGMVRVALEQEVLEEAHVLEGEEGDLVGWLVDYEGLMGVFAVQAGFEAVGAGGAGFLTLDAAAFAVEAAAAGFCVPAPFETSA